jgi:hypothetical protein
VVATTAEVKAAIFAADKVQLLSLSEGLPPSQGLRRDKFRRG